MAAVATGSLPPGSSVPSVRDLAKQLRVNPNTIAKVYQHLGEAEIFETRRGEGTFVANAPPGVPVRERTRRLGDAAERFAVTSAGLGAGADDALAAARKALARHPLETKSQPTEEP